VGGTGTSIRPNFPDLTEGPTTPDTIWGGNMAVRADVSSAGFVSMPHPAREEPNTPKAVNEFVRRLGQQNTLRGTSIMQRWSTFIRDFQMHKSWILAGISFWARHVSLNHANHSIPPVLWFGAPRYLFRQLLGQAVQIMKCMLSFDEKVIFHALWKVHCCRGYIIEARNMQKEQAAVRQYHYCQ